MSAVIGLGNVRAETAASPRPARRRAVPPSLPRALSRLAALAVAAPVTVLAALMVGALGLPLVQTVPLVLGSAMLLVLVSLGVRLRGILVTGVGAAVVAIPVVVLAFFSLLGPSSSIRQAMVELVRRPDLMAVTPLYVTAFVLLLATAVSAVFAVVVYSLSSGARRLGRGVAVGVAASFAATAWLLPTILGFGFVAVAEPMSLLWAAVTAPVAWLAAAAGRTVALRPGVALAVMRDAVFRVLTLAAALTSAIWVGHAVEVQAGRAARGTPLESLAVSAGWAVAVVLFTILGWTAWRVPRWLVVGQLRGRFEAAAVGETLVAAALCCLVPLALWRLDTGVVLGREWLVALAAALSYGWIRLWFAAPAPASNVPLWILVPNGTRGQVASLTARAAGAWRAGQVTLLALPEDAQRIGGEHLWAADLARVMEALFPLRPVHVDDWLDAQPDAWPALPVRELYAPAELWPQILGTRMEGLARPLVVQGPDGPHPVTYFLDRRPTTVALLPRSSAPSVRPGTTAAELTSLAARTIDQTELRSALRSLAPHAPPIRRFVVIFCTPENLAAAERVARLIHAQLDAEGRTIDCYVVRRGAPWWKAPRVQLGSWHLAALVVARSIGRASSSFGWWLASWLVAPMLGDDGATELDVVLWEGSPDAAVPSTSVPAVDRFFAIRAAGASPLDVATLAAAREAGEIRLARGDSTEAAAEVVARKLLAYEMTPLSRLAADAPLDQAAQAPTSEPTPGPAAAMGTAQAQQHAQAAAGDVLQRDAPDPAPRELLQEADSPAAPPERPALFVSGAIVESTAYVHRPLLRGLQERLPRLEVIGSSESFYPDPARQERVDAILARAVATLVIISRAGIRNQFVHREVAAALEQGGRIIPVLLDGANMPMPDELPPELGRLTEWNALRLDALRGGSEALAHFIAAVVEALGADGGTPVSSRPRGSIRIYLCAHAEDGEPHALRLRLALDDRFGPDSTHVDMTASDPPDGPPGTSASMQSGIVALARRLMLRTIVALARAIAALKSRSPQSAVATLARRFLLHAITALARRFPQGSIAALANADVVLVVMGPEFERVVQEGPAERVGAFPLKTTLRAALDMRLRILPVLVGGAVMLPRSALPEDLLRLKEIQAFEIREGAWNDDVDRLGDLIERLTEPERGTPEPA